MIGRPGAPKRGGTEFTAPPPKRESGFRSATISFHVIGRDLAAIRKAATAQADAFVGARLYTMTVDVEPVEDTDGDVVTWEGHVTVETRD